jgi:hypothetical protein
MSQLGFRHTAVNPSRSVLSLALIAFACFVLVSVGAFRKAPMSGGDKTSGTGGFTLMAESVAPLMHDPNLPDGRDGLGLETNDPIFEGARITRFRLRPGDETSCLTLYKPTNPRIMAPGPGFVDEARFSFAASMAATPDEQANPWTLLDRTFDSPPAKRASPPPSSKTASALTAPFVPPPTADQAVPFQRAIPLAGAPPAFAKEPPTYSAVPEPSSWTRSACTSPSTPSPSGAHALPFQRAMRLAGAPPAFAKVPPA